MIITANDLILNDPAGGFLVDGDIVGLGVPDVRTSSGLLSGQHGGWVGAQFYGMRNIAIPGQIIADSVGDYEDRRAALQAAVASNEVTLTIVTNAGHQYVIECNLIKLDIPFSNNPLTCRFNLELVAPDPIIYDNSASGLMSAPLSRVGGGGITWPITWPITWASGTPPVTVNNTGEVALSPTIKLNNAMTNPTITNKTTGQFFTLSGLTTTAGDVVVIDMKNRTALLNGGSVLSLMTAASDWWLLLPGANTLELSTASSGDTVTGVIEWRAGYGGI